MKVSLVFPDQIHLDIIPYEYKNNMKRKRGHKRIAPVGMLAIQANLEIPVQFIDNYIKRLPTKQLVKACLEYVGDKGIVAFGGTCLENPQAVEAAKLIKEKNPEIITVYGGTNATVRPEKHILVFDYVFRGQSIDTFKQFVEGVSPDTIEGVCYKGHIVSPQYTIDFNHYHWKKFPDSKHYANNMVLTSVGCPYSCRFCASKSIWNRNVFYREISDVAEEIHSKRLSYINFRDDNFLISKQRAKEFCSYLRRKKITWSCQARVDSLNEEMIKLLVHSGCVQVSCGFESFNDSTLRAINKKHTTKQIKETIALLEKHSLNYTGGFIVGFPDEGVKEITTTINYVKTLQRKRHNRVPKKVPHFIGFPVSELYNEIIDRGLVEYNWFNGELLFPRTTTLSRSEVENL